MQAFTNVKKTIIKMKRVKTGMKSYGEENEHFPRDV